MLYFSQIPPRGGFKDFKNMSFVTNNALITYLRGAKEELEKVTWPTRKQTLMYSAIVVVVSVVWALYFGVLDFALNWALAQILK